MKHLSHLLSNVLTALAVLGACSLALAAPAQQMILLLGATAVSASNPLPVTTEASGGTSAVNVAQINGVTPLMGNGATGTGSPRVTIASDTTSNTNPFLVNGATTAADTLALTSGVKAVAIGEVYNGTTADLHRSIVTGNNTTGTGVAAVGNLAQCDDTSPQAITENQFGNMRMGCADHALLVAPSAYPNGATPETIGCTASAGTCTATLAASAGKTTYITGFQCTPGSATAAAAVSVVVSGTITGSMTYAVYSTNATTFVPAPVPLIVAFGSPVPASTTNTTIVVTMGSAGAGGTNASCAAQGFQL